MILKTITSLNNQRVKDAIKLRDHRQRAKQQRFFIDGAREILQAIHGEIEFVEWFVCEPLCKTNEGREALTSAGETGAVVWHVAPEVFEKLAYGERREGVLAIAAAPQRTIAEFRVADGGLVAVLVGLEKPGNVGAVLRSADAAGVAGVIVADPRTDLFNPNCIRASLGTVFTKPVCTATTAEAIAWLRERHGPVYAARPDAARSYFEVDYGGNATIVLGSEAAGLPDAWQGPEMTSVKLPMLGAADSLNVSATAAVLFYEALRQRAGGVVV